MSEKFNSARSPGVLNNGWQRISRFWRTSLASNPRLLWLVALVAVVVLVELGLRWYDDVQLQLKQRAELQSTLSLIKTQVKDPKNLENTLTSANAAKALADGRVLQVGFEALAQAQLHDWVGKMTKEANVEVLRLTVGSARAVAARSSGNASGNALNTAAETSLALAPTSTLSAAKTPMVEVPITLVMRFSPQTLGSVLERIEGGEWLVRVETLSVRRNERRVEIGMVVPVRLQGGMK